MIKFSVAVFACVAIALAYPAYAQSEVDLTEAKSLEYDLEFRVWKDASGQFSVTGKYVSSDTTSVKIKRKDNGKLVEVAIAKLSLDDQSVVKRIVEHEQEVAKQQKLDSYTHGIDKFVTKAETFRRSMEAIELDKSLTTALRNSQSAECYKTLYATLENDYIGWVVKVEDVYPPTDGMIPVKVRDFYDGCVASTIEIVKLPATAYKIEDIAKGELLLLKLVSPTPGGGLKPNTLVYRKHNSNRSRQNFESPFVLAIGQSKDDVSIGVSAEFVEKITETNNPSFKTAKFWFQKAYGFLEGS